MHNHTMKKHTLSGIRVLNNFSFESEGLRVWKACNIGPGRLFSSVKGFGTPQRPNDLSVVLRSTCVNWCFQVDNEERCAPRGVS